MMAPLSVTDGRQFSPKIEMHPPKPMNIPRVHLPSRRQALAAAILFLTGTAALPPSQAQSLFHESFDTLPLGPNVEEASVGAQVWTKTPPDGWTIDDSRMPGFGTPTYADLDGRREWAGWAFADVKWWPTVDNQRRAEFTLASGAAAIADPDEWDDAPHHPGLFNTFLTTSEISVAGKAANSLVLMFDSSWRPEFSDDGLPSFPVDPVTGDQLNDQTAIISAQWDNGASVEVVKWESDPDSPNFKRDGDFINEAALLELKNPAGARTLKLTFAMVEAANDWWWAFDNVAVGEPPMLAGIQATGIGFSARLREGLGKTINEAAPITAKLDGQTVTVSSARDGDHADTVVVGHDQAPTIFAPRSRHVAEITFRAGDGRTITDRATFVAPGYSSVSVTPTVLNVSLNETTYLTVDEPKGIQLELDGVALPGASVSVTREDLTSADGDLPDRILATHTFATVLASGSNHSLKVKYTARNGQAFEETLPFTAAKFTDIPAGLATAVDTGAEPGLRWRTHQLAGGRPANDAANVEKQLRGELGASVHDPSGQNAQGFFPLDYVNLDQAGNDAANFKNSTTAAELAVGDLPIPGIPGLDPANVDNNIAAEALAYVEIPAPGLYATTVNADDGFQLSVGNASNPSFLVLGTKLAANTTFHFRVQQAGVYLFRLLYWENSGGANVEWFTTDAAGKWALVNGPQTGATPLKAFQRRTVAEPALPVTTPTLGISAQNQAITVTFTGTLQAADSVQGPYTTVSGATSPYAVSATAAGKFYRAQQ